MTTSFAAVYDAERAEDEDLEFWAKVLSLPTRERAIIAATIAAAFRRAERARGMSMNSAPATICARPIPSGR